MSDQRRAALVQRLWWANLVLGLVFFALAGRRLVMRDDGWGVFFGFWVVLGLIQIGVGLLNRRAGRRVSSR